MTELVFLDMLTASSLHCKRCSHQGCHTCWTAAACEVLQRVCPGHMKPGLVRLTRQCRNAAGGAAVVLLPQPDAP